MILMGVLLTFGLITNLLCLLFVDSGELQTFILRKAYRGGADHSMTEWDKFLIESNSRCGSNWAHITAAMVTSI